MSENARIRPLKCIPFIWIIYGFEADVFFVLEQAYRKFSFASGDRHEVLLRTIEFRMLPVECELRKEEIDVIADERSVTFKVCEYHPSHYYTKKVVEKSGVQP